MSLKYPVSSPYKRICQSRDKSNVYAWNIFDRYLTMKQGEVNKFETLNQLIGNIDVVFQFFIWIKAYLDLIWLLCNYYRKNHLLFCDKRDATHHKHLRVNRPSIFKSLSFKKIYLGISYYVNIEIHYHSKQTYYRKMQMIDLYTIFPTIQDRNFLLI